jgi:16S rRNA (guanine527-N7)-methyltransferase
VTSREFRDRVVRRARRIDLTVPGDVLAPLEQYFELLRRWNAKINLTALPLQGLTDVTIDRLLLEPIAAARHLREAKTWVDLGSGGGSPAIPLKLVRTEGTLIMVESKTRKAAFLKEAVRVLSLNDATVENVRFEEFAAAEPRAQNVDLVTVRAVRTDSALFLTAARLLRDRGQLALFGGDSQPRASGFRFDRTEPLIPGAPSYLTSLTRVFHVEHRG